MLTVALLVCSLPWRSLSPKVGWYGVGITDPDNRARKQAVLAIVDDLKTLLKPSGKQPEAIKLNERLIYVTSDGYLNRDSLKLLLFYAGFYDTQTDHLSLTSDLTAVFERMLKADFVVANDPGANWSWNVSVVQGEPRYSPAELIQTNLLTVLKTNTEFRLFKSYESVSGQSFYLYVRAGKPQHEQKRE
jgi:hypothetical protein